MPPSPIIQQPVTPQYYSHQQPPQLHQYQSSSQLPQSSVQLPPQQHQTPIQRSQSNQQQQQEIAQAAVAAANRRQQVSRGLQYKDNSTEVRKPTSSAGLNVDSFRLLSVLGRGHFGKVILSQYKNTSMKL